MFLSTPPLVAIWCPQYRYTKTWLQGGVAGRLY